MLLDHVREVFYGGAAGGGKSDALLMGALQYVDEPGYAALILRRNFKQLNMPGALMNRSHLWLDGTDAVWREGTKTWTFPSNATITFGHFGTTEEARTQYESAEFQYIAIDEVTGFAEEDYRFMFSRLRRLKGSRVPIRMRSASNPTGRGREWVKRRFVDATTRRTTSVFVPAFLWDNPYLDADEYIESLRELHPVMWKRLLRGDWDAADPGTMFQPRIWLDEDDYLEQAPVDGVAKRVRYWDLAATEQTASSPDPDWTAGAKVSRLSTGFFVVEHVLRVRATPGKVETIVAHTATTDGEACTQWMDQDPGQAGKAQAEHYKRTVFPDDIRARSQPVVGNKALRARPFAAAMEKHRVKVVVGEWNDSFFDELEAFSDVPKESGPHDDQVDASSGAYSKVRVKAVSGATSVQGTVNRN